MSQPVYISLDCETAPVEPGNLRPALTCVSWARDGDIWLEDHEDGPRNLQVCLTEPAYENYHFVGHNIAFDLAVVAQERPSLLPCIFAAYRAGRFHDTKIRQQLLDIATGSLRFRTDELGAIVKSEYSLAGLAKRLLGRTVAKDDKIRLAFGPYRGRINELPAEMRAYALEDARVTLEVFRAQKDGRDITDETAQCRADWALHLMSCEGLRTDLEAVRTLRGSLDRRYDDLQRVLFDAGLLRVGGTKKSPRICRKLAAIRSKVETAFHGDPPRTDKGAVSTSEDTLLRSADTDLAKVAELVGIEKLRNTYLPFLERGVINPRYNVLVASGRTSSMDPNIQNLPRDGAIRPCIVPRPGHVFVAADYDTIEMRALGQVHLEMFGKSALADALRAGQDLHLAGAAKILGLSYVEAQRFKAQPEIKNARQMFKVANYGYAGGMSARTFVEYARTGYGLEITLQQAQAARDDFFQMWPEMRPYLARISQMLGKNETCTIHQIGSRRRRGGVRYCEAANGYFQGLAADGAKAALFAVARECYADDKSPESTSVWKISPLLGCRPVAFIHDEILLEAPAGNAELAAQRLVSVMERSMEQFIPDIPIKATAKIMERWTK